MSNRILFGSISNPGDFTILAASKPYEDVKEITSFVEDFIVAEGNFTKEFRWSPDGIAFSQWVSLTLEEIQQSIDLDKFPKFWMEFKYELIDAGNVGIESVKLNVTYNAEKIMDYPYPIAYARDKGNKTWPVRIRSFTWNPYKQENAIKLQKDLSLLVNQIHGHEITYFRATPVPESVDVVFLEYTLQNVENNPKCIKVLVPDNSFPEHKLNHNAFGLDFELPFEVHIDRRYFEWVFGHNAKPQKRDIIYFPLTNRMYEVESANIAVQFMYDFLYWQLNLVKWQPKANVLLDHDVKSLLDEYSTGIEDMFGNELANIYKDISNPQQLKDKSTKFDPIRNFLSPNNISTQETFINYYTTIAEYYYDLNKDYIASGKLHEKSVGYDLLGDFLRDDDLAYTCWFRNPTLNYVSKDVASVTISGTTVSIKFRTGLPKVVVGDTLGLSDPTMPNFGLFGTITAIDTNIINLVITMEVDSSMLIAANTQYPTWASSLTMKGIETPRANFLYSFNTDTNKGIILDIYDSRYLRVQLNTGIVWIPLAITLQDNTWYGLVINILNKFNQLSYHIYQQKPAASKTTKLDLIATQLIKGLPNVDRRSGIDYQILASPLHLTNIRLLNESLEGDLHSKWLNMQLINDGSKALIIDNCIPRMALPYIGIAK